MPSNSSPQIPKAINGLLILGIIGYLLVLWLVFFLFFKFEKGSDTNTTPNLVGELGAEGSTCGGSARLPCNPGLVCNAQPGSSTAGTCVKDTRDATPPGEAGEACGGDVGCGPGLLCVATEEGSFCMPVTTSTAPVAQ